MSYAERVDELRSSVPKGSEVPRFPFLHDLIDLWSEASGPDADRACAVIKELPDTAVFSRASIDSLFETLSTGVAV